MLALRWFVDGARLAQLDRDNGNLSYRAVAVLAPRSGRRNCQSTGYLAGHAGSELG
ncbi:hypothetical protein [Streptomyces sp. CdTB01]|uniref:hypothetical protein n=1 Tax=Streptomyces sp. CdTB01 TaxID=1725411 RepID=UPI000A8B33C1|nr:hypothetical protein [Streptomyces sp. CdTB01]